MTRTSLAVLYLASFGLWAQKPKPEAPAEAGAAQDRTQLNLLGQTDTRSGENRRNENVQINLIDNNALKELNQRIGTTAAWTTEFAPERNYFASEYGQAAAGPFLAAPGSRAPWRGSAHWTHLNSLFSARSFFQAGDVLPARENEVKATAGGALWRGAALSLNGGLQRIRGMVNGNILAPLPSERTALAADPRARAYVQRLLDAYPRVAPNRPDIDARMVNTNSPQQVNNDHASGRLEQRLTEKDSAVLSYSFLTQKVLAFQLVKGQNPDTATRAHTAAATWNRTWAAGALSQVGFRFDRADTLLAPENNNPGPQVFISNVLTQINPHNAVPTDRAQNTFRSAGQVRRAGGRHSWTAGFEALRRQLNGLESDAHLGALMFNNNYGNDAITNLRLGLPTTYFQAAGELQRGYRYWEHWIYAGGKLQVSPRLTVSYGAGYRPLTRPTEVNRKDRLPYASDWNNLGPQAGIAWRPPRAAGVWRAAFGTHFGEICPVTFQQIRFNAPGNVKRVVQDPDLLNPLGAAAGPVRSVLYDYPADLVSPYSMQWSLVWEVEPRRGWKWSQGYVGSRAVKLLHHWYNNRAHPQAGVPLTTGTIDERRARPRYVDVRRVTNGSRAYYDAYRTSLVASGWRGAAVEFSYWFSKALDLGSDYTNVAHDNDSFRSRSQYEFDVHKDMKGRSRFDQPHAALARVGYALPLGAARARRFGAWTISSVVLAKSGTPFNLGTGSDAPGFGNVDGTGGDRPSLLDPAILGRAITHPDLSRRQLPRAAFRYILPGERSGNLGRNVFRRAPIRNWNAALAGDWRLRGERRLSLRGEAINLTNTPQFAEPGFSLTDPTFGAITNTLNDGRTFRLQVGLSF